MLMHTCFKCMHQNTRIQSIGNTFYAQYRWLLQHRLSKNVLTGQGFTLDSNVIHWLAKMAQMKPFVNGMEFSTLCGHPIILNI